MDGRFQGDSIETIMRIWEFEDFKLGQTGLSLINEYPDHN